MAEQFQKVLRFLHSLPLRIVAYLLVIPLGIGVWAVTHIFPQVDRETAVIAGAAIVAVAFAFGRVGRPAKKS